MSENHSVAPRGRASHALVVAVLAVAATTGSATAASDLVTWAGPEGLEVRFASQDDLRSFFETASIEDREAIAEGVTRPTKLLLRRGSVRLHAHFQPIDEVYDKARTARGEVEIGSRDSYKFNLAAYRLGSLLGLDNIPPSFARSIDRRPGSITAWVENAFTERDRQENGQKPPDPQRWGREVARMVVFDELIANSDRNQGNILIGEGWKFWLIDHTRAFRPRTELAEPAAITTCERDLWIGLKTLSDERLRGAVVPWLSRREIRGLLSRRQALVAHIETLIRARSEADILYDLD